MGPNPGTVPPATTPAGGTPAYATIIGFCPASIFLLGSAAQCSKGKGHDGNHSVTIEWIVR